MIRILFLIFLLSACGKPINDKTNAPEIQMLALKGVDEKILLETNMFYHFDLLPLQGSVERKERLWSGSSWPLKSGAINFRWNSSGKEAFNYRSPSAREIGAYSPEKLKELSPSEKYDIWMGRYDYPLKYEVDSLARSGTLPWEGLCHGFAGATINHAEPSPKIMENPDGFLVPFGSADIKALLTYAYSKVLLRDTEFVGQHCGEGIRENCNVLSAMGFHIVLTNMIGLRGKSLIADLDQSSEVWNHPLLSYQIKPKNIFSSGSGRRALLEAKINYIDVTKNNSWDKRPPLISSMTVEYELFIDKNGNIINGQWISRLRPDFLWTVERREVFEGYLSKVLKLTE